MFIQLIILIKPVFVVMTMMILTIGSFHYLTPVPLPFATDTCRIYFALSHVPSWPVLFILAS